MAESCEIHRRITAGRAKCTYATVVDVSWMYHLNWADGIALAFESYKDIVSRKTT
jgi:hypothetical protein